MIKRTLYFGSPAYLSLKLGQLEIRLPEVELTDSLPAHIKKAGRQSIPIEDLGIVVLDHKQITITQALLSALIQNGCAIISCDDSHHPTGMLLSFLGHSELGERVHDQIGASLPLKKQMWQQTIRAKIANQAVALSHTTKQPHPNMHAWIDLVKSGDANNIEARAAAYYWTNIFPELPSFKRDREGDWTNKLLNYGYAIVRAMAARAITAAGLLPSVGIFHHNKYNHFCLADDLMEPYRPYVDILVYRLIQKDIKNPPLSLSSEHKRELLSLPVMDTIIDGRTHPMSIAMHHSATSLYLCFAGKERRILYPHM
ncbi:CRISPR-associated protein Cas1 [Porphyromonas gulae]|uniref:type II CRISPR-associated endonuclease Cas1 n=1 Tax=Porphyromonas TaxID=836 RepID=UPI00051DB8E5|nr:MULTISPECIES: type II CRISPR-associated endonuclease Cas1 [Porphyromonas]KGL49146.1 CRISPR-associated protein Cas1 [Porphyromonas gulae]KGL55069.1 CRISPR-associated protein Cas1 [Porphyromonas sp. COT-052 OH4946]KGN74096.1 CRISPR-associated protein Cas1 [Porphyromonas gulae]KGO04775.1 CRISPR-associated protein Cas1 [Porphyromonas gulae]